MAKRRRRVVSTYPPRQRYSYAVPGYSVRPVSPTNYLSILQAIEDRRTWHPSPYTRPLASFTVGKRSTIKHASKTSLGGPASFSRAALTFAQPKKLALCIRRAQRKQVIHAKGIAGGRVRRPRRNQWSEISCRS